MQPASQSEIDFDGIDLRAVRRRFLTINHDRLKRVRASLRDNQKSFLDLLPLLFHINHPMLPGYVSAKTPAGISDYSPTRRSIAAGKDLSQSFIYSRRAKRNFDLHAIFIMGSSGTIAYSATSDFDIWLCVRPNLAPAAQSALRRKAQGIESWAASLNLEVHFFLMNDDAFRSGKLDHLSEEGSGTAQHHLLLDEFYRTGLLVAGRYPVWWLVPPRYESDYDYYVAELKRKRFVGPHETVDFGGVAHIPPGEFFGATLWQLYKGVSSPYKSVLKLMLMEAYADEYPNIRMLSLDYKQAVHGGETRLDELDPYVSMCNRVEAYLTARGEAERLELARRCFYFKVRERMSRPERRGNITWRRELMRELVTAWKWSQSRLLMLDARPSWKILRVLEERKTLVHALSESYRMLSAFAREYADSQTIDPRELNLLGRRLYTAFERKAGKVDIINPGISENLIENRLSLHQIGNQQGGWVLYRGDVRPEDAERHALLKRGHSLVEVIAWCHFNGLLHPVASMVSLHPDDCGVSVWELRSIMDCLQDLFPDVRMPETNLEDLARSARIQKAVVIVNIGTDPLSRINREGLLRVSNRTDALSYGGCRENLAVTFDQVLVNSWQEVLTSRYRNRHALMEWLCDYLAWYPQSAGEAPPVPAVFSFSSTRGAPIAYRIEELAKQVIQCFYHSEGRERARYVVQVSHHYYVLQPENDVPRYTYMASSSALLNYLSLPQSGFSPIILDQHALAETRIPMLLSVNLAGKVQLFYEACGDKADVFVLDEFGSLFQQRTAFHDHYALLAQYRYFLESVQRRRDPLLQEQGAATSAEPVLYYQIIGNRTGQAQLKNVQANPAQQSEDYFGVQVIGEIVDTDQVVFNIYCSDEEFSTLEYGEQLFTEVARYILRQRPSGQAYPIYITDIDLPHGAIDSGNPDQLQTIHLLKHKQRIEQRLNDALAGLQKSAEEECLVAGSVSASEPIKY